MVLTASVATAQPSLGTADSFAVLAGTAVTCTNVDVTGDVGALGAITQTVCTVAGTVHRGDSAARRAFSDFMTAYNDLEDNPPACDATLTGTLAGLVLEPGVYCVSATAKTGTLTLDAQNDANAHWLFLVRDGAGTGALTGTNFNVVMINGGEPCDVTWWVEAAATLTDSNFLGTILAGAGITVTRGTFIGHALATAAATLTGLAAGPRTTVKVCSSGNPPPDDDCKKSKCKCKCKCKHHDGGHDGDHDGDHHNCGHDRHHGDDDHDGHHGDNDDHDHHGGNDHKDKDRDNDHKGGYDSKGKNDKDRNGKGWK